MEVHDDFLPGRSGVKPNELASDLSNNPEPSARGAARAISFSDGVSMLLATWRRSNTFSKDRLSLLRYGLKNVRDIYLNSL